MSIENRSKKLEKHIVPILGVKNKLVVFVGTGFIYRFKGNLYLVSASHVFDELKKSASGVNIGIPPKIVTIKQNGTYRTVGKSGTGRDCTTDVMASPISKENEEYDLIESIAVDNEWIYDSELTGLSGRMLIQGFPSSKNKQPKILNRESRILEVVSSSFTTECKEIEYSDYNKCQKEHIALGIPKVDCDGQVFHSLNGMSGCPLWMVPENDDRAFLMGLFTEYKAENELGFATKLRSVEHLITEMEKMPNK